MQSVSLAQAGIVGVTVATCREASWSNGQKVGDGFDC